MVDGLSRSMVLIAIIRLFVSYEANGEALGVDFMFALHVRSRRMISEQSIEASRCDLDDQEHLF